MKKSKRQAPKPPQQFVVGRRENGFCWILPRNNEESADDQNLESARIFSSLPDAILASAEHNCSVFEILSGPTESALKELMVDLRAIEAMPFEGCYPVMEDDFIAGPSFVRRDWHTTEGRLLRLARARISCIISLVSRAELFWHDGQVGDVLTGANPAFRQHFFPIADGAVPTQDLMIVILDTIAAALGQDEKVFIHCVGGRGRTGMVASCFAARHGVATGQRLINWLAERRYQHGLFKPSPETDAQCDFVRRWKEGV
jgi:hypothetical protein